MALTDLLASFQLRCSCSLDVQHVADFPDQHFFRKWFVKKNHSLLKHSVPGDKAIGVARDIQDSHAKLLGQQFFRESSPIDAWHNDIGEQKVDFSWVPGFNL